MSELMRTQLWGCGACDAVATADAWGDAWWRRRARYMADPEVKAEARDELASYADPSAHQVAEYVARIATARMRDSMVCPVCFEHLRDGDDGAGVRDLVGFVDPLSVVERS